MHVSSSLPAHLEQKVTKGKFSLYEHFPFFAQLCQHFNVVSRPGHGTASIDANGNLYLDPAFVEKLNEKDMLFVLCHEAFHIVNETAGSRLPEGGNLNVWNVAADVIINHILVDDAKIPMIRPEVIKPIYGGKYAKYKGSTTELVYADMMQNPEKMLGQSLAEFDKACEGANGTNPQQGPGKGSMKGQWFDNSAGNLSKKGQDKGLDKSGNPQSEGGMTEQQKAEWTDRISAAWEAQKAIGDCPGGIAQFVTKMQAPKKNWKKELRVAVVSSIQDQWSWKKPSRRTSGLEEVRTPGVWGEKPDCWCALDTSGSMSEPELQRAISEISAIFKLVGGKTHLILCDAEVYWTGDLDAKGLQNLREIQHGGTDLRKIFEYIKENTKKKPPAMLVIFSDMETPFPSRPPKYPVIWCNPGGDSKAPWGKNIKVEL